MRLARGLPSLAQFRTNKVQGKKNDERVAWQGPRGRRVSGAQDGVDGRCSDGQIATTRPQADAFHDWFGQVMTIIRKFDLGSFESEYMQRLRALRARLKTFTPDTDYDASTIQASRQVPPSRSKAEPGAAP